MKAAIILCLLLMACIQIEQPVNETVYKTEVVNVSEPKTNDTVPVLETNINILDPEIITNETVAPEDSLITGLVIEDLSIGKQHKMIPELQSVVGNSSCYNITWDGFDEQSANWPLEIRREQRFEYLGGTSWKGWITSKLSISRKVLSAETLSVMVDNLSVSCENAENFSIDWEKALANNMK